MTLADQYHYPWNYQSGRIRSFGFVFLFKLEKEERGAMDRKETCTN
jgi:hypothetical protein